MERLFNISSLFFAAAQTYPHKIAIQDLRSAISFADLARQVQDTASYLKQRGISKGDRVLVFVPMGIDLYRTVLALFYMGATAVFVDEWTNRKRLDLCCEIADCTAFIGSWKAQFLQFFSKGVRRIPLKLSTTYKKQDVSIDAVTAANDAALITFTTGSTGRPKAAVRTHDFLMEQFHALAEKLAVQPATVDMSVLPILLLINLAVGSTSVIADFNSRKPTSLDVSAIVEQLNRHKVSRVVASPYFIKRLAQYILQERVSLPFLQELFTGGAPVFQSEALLFVRAFGEKSVQIVYGSTEAEPISSIRAADLAAEHPTFDVRKGLCVGIPYHKTKVKIIGIIGESLYDVNESQFLALQLPEGEWGEIVVSGPHVLAHYFKDEQAMLQNKILVDGVFWHRTGDSGYLSEGQLYLTGRCKTLIATDKGWVSPFVFENYVQSIAGVEIGTLLCKDRQWIAFIELQEGVHTHQAVADQIRALPLAIHAFRFGPIPRDPRHHSKIEYDKL